jgi:hypothetical protein
MVTSPSWCERRKEAASYVSTLCILEGGDTSLSQPGQDCVVLLHLPFQTQVNPGLLSLRWNPQAELTEPNSTLCLWSENLPLVLPLVTKRGGVEIQPWPMLSPQLLSPSLVHRCAVNVTAAFHSLSTQKVPAAPGASARTAIQVWEGHGNKAASLSLSSSFTSLLWTVGEITTHLLRKAIY